jgi:hypothetical protein
VLDQVTSLMLAFFLVFGRIEYSADRGIGYNRWSSVFAGAQIYPSTGGLRFAWALLLLLVVVRATWRLDAGTAVSGHLLAGSAIWLVGCLWSFESAFYCCCTWLPAFAILAWRSRRWLLAVPPLLAAAAAAVVLGALTLRLGHPPDPRGYYEYALTYAGGFGSEPIPPAGPVWLLLLTFATILAAVATSRGAGAAGLIAAAGLVWSTGSYFVSRGYPAVVEYLSPMVVSGLLLSVRIPRRAASMLPRQVAAAVLAVFMLGPLSFEPALSRYVRTPPAPTRIDALRPHVASSLQELIDRSDMRAGEPVAYVGDEPASILMPVWRDPGGRQVTESPLWLPLAPAGQLGLLPADRRLVYLDRFSRSWPDGGWLVEADRPSDEVSWLHAWLPRHYQVTETVSGGGWRLTRYGHR